ncbi:MAG: phosphate-starvation-inducible PsiE family protein [Halobellus sp.]|uniref:phosphate-starvation-inducible PsiE family protein n=1 Tax=Halobellus sp. TaxID=1979212 RepID=UPI0035D4B0B6
MTEPRTPDGNRFYPRGPITSTITTEIEDETDSETTASPERRFNVTIDRTASHIEDFVHIVEIAAAAIFALLFAIGVIDLAIQILERIQSGEIANPRAVIKIIDTGLLLLIIVEVYQTVIAYTQRTDTRRIVRLIIYTGIIAVIRKLIIFRTTDYASTQDALFAATAYTLTLVSLSVILYIEQRAITE